MYFCSELDGSQLDANFAQLVHGILPTHSLACTKEKIFEFVGSSNEEHSIKTVVAQNYTSVQLIHILP